MAATPRCSGALAARMTLLGNCRFGAQPDGGLSEGSTSAPLAWHGPRKMASAWRRGSTLVTKAFACGGEAANPTAAGGSGGTSCGRSARAGPAAALSLFQDSGCAPKLYISRVSRRSRRAALSPQTLAVLAALIARPSDWRHGYDLAGETGLKSGTLYPILVRLADREIVQACWEEGEPAGRPRRHLYRLTSDGLATATAALAAAPQAGASPARSRPVAGRPLAGGGS